MIITKIDLPSDILPCLQVATKLPDSFTESAFIPMEHALKTNEVLVAKESELVLGFIATQNKNADQEEIEWLAVLPDKQGMGIGTALVKRVHQEAKVHGIKSVMVKTLAETDETKDVLEYYKTRRFYENLGYRLQEVIDPYLPWDGGNPCAVYVFNLVD